MKIPSRLIPLVEDGIIDEVIGQVKSGKEADVFIVRVGEDIRCAKIYKEANNRSFRQAIQYQEGRKAQGSRNARAMAKRTQYGKKEAEASWMNAEVKALNTLSAAGLRVPMPFGLFDGVLIMELIVDADGYPAPRLNDVSLTPDEALQYHEELIVQVIRMLCAGIIHGDLSEFNVLVDAYGPVIIDLPQAVNAAGNSNASVLFARDVNNLAHYFSRFEPGILTLKYAKEIWSLYEKGKLTPDVNLTGEFQESTKQVDVGSVLTVIGDAKKEHEARLLGKSKGSSPVAPIKSWQSGDQVTRPAESPEIKAIFGIIRSQTYPESLSPANRLGAERPYQVLDLLGKTDLSCGHRPDFSGPDDANVNCPQIFFRIVFQRVVIKNINSQKETPQICHRMSAVLPRKTRVKALSSWGYSAI